MKVFVEHRTYEQDGDEWIERNGARRQAPLLQRIALLTRTALALACIAAIGIVAASLALVLLPVAFLASWWLGRGVANEIRRVQ